MDLAKIRFGTKPVEVECGGIVLDEDSELVRNALNNYLWHNWHSYVPDDFSMEWDTEDPTYGKGTLPKRIANFCFQSQGREIGKEARSALGTIYREYVPKSRSLYIDFTRKLRWKRGRFSDSRSCFWTEKKEARTIMQDNGVIAFRVYEKIVTCPEVEDTFEGKGRCWMMMNFPIEDTVTIWNAYGFKLNDMAFFLSSYLDAETHATRYMSNYGDTRGTIFINNGVSEVIGSKEKLRIIPDILDLKMYVPEENDDPFRFDDPNDE
jgi:hypothetical protein